MLNTDPEIIEPLDDEERDTVIRATSFQELHDLLERLEIMEEG